MAYINKFLEHLAPETESTFKAPHRLARFWDRLREVRRARACRQRPVRRRRRRRRNVRPAHAPACSPATAACSKPRSTPCATCRRSTARWPSAPRKATAGSTRSASAATSSSAQSAPTACRPTRRSASPTSGAWSTPAGCSGAPTPTRSWSATSARRSGVGALFDAEDVREHRAPREPPSAGGTGLQDHAAEMARHVSPRSTAHAPTAGARCSTSTAPAATRRSRPTAACALYQLFSLDEVGTDPMTAINFERQVMPRRRHGAGVSATPPSA